MRFLLLPVVVVGLLFASAAIAQSVPGANGVIAFSPGVQGIDAYSYNCMRVGQTANPCSFPTARHAAFGFGAGADVPFSKVIGAEVELDGIRASQPAALAMASADLRGQWTTAGGWLPFVEAGYSQSFGDGSRGWMNFGLGADFWNSHRWGWRIGFRGLIRRGSAGVPGVTIPSPGRQIYLLTLGILVR